jgi:hypothetical protein
MSGTPTFTPGGVPPGPRRVTQQSTRLLHEWSQTQLWEVPPIHELRLGPTPLSAAAPVLTPEIEGMLRRANRYADMVGITATEIQVIEAEMVADPGSRSQLEYYIDLVHTTPLLQQYPSKRVQGVLLWAVGDPVLQQKANAVGIRVVIWTPPWAQEYLATKYYRR